MKGCEERRRKSQHTSLTAHPGAVSSLGDLRQHQLGIQEEMVCDGCMYDAPDATYFAYFAFQVVDECCVHYGDVFQVENIFLRS